MADEPNNEPPFPAPGENRLYLVNTSSRIFVYPKILESRNCFDLAGGKNSWADVLRRLATESPRALFTGVEIHCHGQPEQILLGPTITRDNVLEFGRLLRQVIKPGALVEVLCCKVAMTWFREECFTDFGPCLDVMNPAELACVRKYCDTYANFEKMLERQLRPIRAEHIGWSEPHKLRVAMQMMSPHVAWRSIFNIAMHYDGIAVWPRRNGLKFSAMLSNASGARVRTAWVEQLQDRKLGDHWLIGDWEGFVFDFVDGGMAEAYFNLARPQANRPAYVAANLVPMNSNDGRHFARTASSVA